jgi:hypothetical protein
MWNNATQISSTIIYVSHLTRDGVDIDVFLALIKTNDSLILQDENNSNNYQKWTVNNTPTIIPNNYVSIPVTYIEGGYSFANGHDMIFVPLSIGIEGPQGFQGFQGPTGADGNSYVVTPNGFNSVWYNGGDAVDPNFSSMNESYSDGDGLYLTKGNLTLVEDISSPNNDSITITTENLTGLGTYVWTIPVGTDTFVGRDSTQLLSNKTFTTIAINSSGITSSKGDIFYTPSNGGNLQRLPIGATGSILGATNGIPTWITPGTFSSVLTISDTGVPVWKQRNFIKATDGTAITGTVATTYTDGVFIPANSVSVGDVVEFRTRARKLLTNGSMVIRAYVGVNNSLTAANLIATSANAGNTVLSNQIARRMVVKSATQSEVFSTTTAFGNDDGAASVVVSVINIDWTLNQYFVVSIQNASALDTTRSSFLQVKIYE